MENKKNLVYFEGSSMKELYQNMKNWQDKNEKRLLSLSIEKEDGIYCCIGLSNPTEVVIVSSEHTGGGYAEIGQYTPLSVYNRN